MSAGDLNPVPHVCTANAFISFTFSLFLKPDNEQLPKWAAGKEKLSTLLKLKATATQEAEVEGTHELTWAT